MRPTDEQMKTALDAADRMWSRGVDPHHMARVLRYLHDRNALLEELLRRTDRLVRFAPLPGLGTGFGGPACKHRRGQVAFLHISMC